MSTPHETAENGSIQDPPHHIRPRGRTTEQWEDWWFLNVLIFGAVVIALGIIFAISTTAEPTQPDWFGVEAALHETAALFSGVLGLWAAFMLAVSVLGLHATKRQLRISHRKHKD